jgi:hypothetical protein
MRGLLILFGVITLALNQCSAFYLPGVAPQDFKRKVQGVSVCVCQ